MRKRPKNYVSKKKIKNILTKEFLKKISNSKSLEEAKAYANSSLLVIERS